MIRQHMEGGDGGGCGETCSDTQGDQTWRLKGVASSCIDLGESFLRLNFMRKYTDGSRRRFRSLTMPRPSKESLSQQTHVQLEDLAHLDHFVKKPWCNEPEVL